MAKITPEQRRVVRLEMKFKQRVEDAVKIFNEAMSELSLPQIQFKCYLTNKINERKYWGTMKFYCEQAKVTYPHPGFSVIFPKLSLDEIIRDILYFYLPDVLSLPCKYYSKILYADFGDHKPCVEIFFGDTIIMISILSETKEGYKSIFKEWTRDLKYAIKLFIVLAQMVKEACMR